MAAASPSYSSRAGLSQEVTLPIVGAASTLGPREQTPAAYIPNAATEQVQNDASHARLPGISQEPDCPSSDGCEGDNEDSSSDDGAKDSKTSVEGSEDEERGKKDGNDESGIDGTQMPDVEELLHVNEEDSRLQSFPADVRCEMIRYINKDRKHLLRCFYEELSFDEMWAGMQKNMTELLQGVKRARPEMGDDDEAEEMLNARAKRTRRGGDVGSYGQPFYGFNGQQSGGGKQAGHYMFEASQPSPWGEYCRQGALASISRRPTTRPVGSAVQRLHHDRLRRPAPKAMQERFPVYMQCPQPEVTVDGGEYTVYSVHTDSQRPPFYPQQEASYGDESITEQPQPGMQQYHQQEITMSGSRSYTNTGEAQAHPSSGQQRHASGERYGSVLDHQNTAGNTPSNVVNGHLDGYNSQNPQPPDNPSSHVETAANEAGGHIHRAPHRAYHRPAATYLRDDPFFSDELFNGMLNGHPDNHHVGSMYTHARQEEIDDHYRRVLAPRPRSGPETNAQNDTVASPPRLRMQALPADLLDANGRLLAGQGGDDVAGWNREWSAFIDDHDAEPLLRAHCPGEYPPRFSPGAR